MQTAGAYGQTGAQQQAHGQIWDGVRQKRLEQHAYNDLKQEKPPKFRQRRTARKSCVVSEAGGYGVLHVHGGSSYAFEHSTDVGERAMAKRGLLF